MSDVIIQVENLSKQYRLGEVSTGSLHHDVNRWWYRVRGLPDPYLSVTGRNIRTGKAEGRQRGTTESTEKTEVGRTKNEERRTKNTSHDDYVWALKDINFEVKQGEVLGIIGRNGAGKSTLLKILSRITAPTTGAVRVKGRIASLLEVGTGFHQDLTGRENIYLNGAILGMTKNEIQRKFDEIVEFSGCAAFIDTPVKRYSSGMHVRLAFAVAAHLEPEILVIDEVLAVGDAEFQRKCLGKMSEVASQGRTVLFVSHNIAAIETLCSSAIWLDGGTVAMDKGETSAVVSAYEKSSRVDSGVVGISPTQHRVVSPFQFRRIEILGIDGRPTPLFKYGEPVRLRLVCSCSETMTGVRSGIVIRSNGLILTTLLSGDNRFSASTAFYVLDCVIPGGILLPGMFELDIGSSRHPENLGLDYVRNAISFSVSDSGIDRNWIYDRKMAGVVRVAGEWARPETIEA